MLAVVLFPGVASADEMTWEGTWNNKKYGTSGPLKCVATETKKGQWSGTFTGTFKGDPFKYEATFRSRKARGGQALAGTATIRGHQYQWTGSMKDGTLSGKYRNNVGYYGEFVLQQSSARNGD
ncbi:MAG: hypothetical protein KDA79_06125 [Planctomycetaceae bacterium]|nr:hypothetical protein [Planctomycetaceae bacterium]